MGEKLRFFLGEKGERKRIKEREERQYSLLLRS
jgi:hypothetical protein